MYWWETTGCVRLCLCRCGCEHVLSNRLSYFIPCQSWACACSRLTLYSQYGLWEARDLCYITIFTITIDYLQSSVMLEVLFRDLLIPRSSHPPSLSWEQFRSWQQAHSLSEIYSSRLQICWPRWGWALRCWSLPGDGSCPKPEIYPEPDIHWC